VCLVLVTDNEYGNRTITKCTHTHTSKASRLPEETYRVSTPLVKGKEVTDKECFDANMCLDNDSTRNL